MKSGTVTEKPGNKARAKPKSPLSEVTLHQRLEYYISKDDVWNILSMSNLTYLGGVNNSGVHLFPHSYSSLENDLVRINIIIQTKLQMGMYVSAISDRVKILDHNTCKYILKSTYLVENHIPKFCRNKYVLQHG